MAAPHQGAAAGAGELPYVGEEPGEAGGSARFTATAVRYVQWHNRDGCRAGPAASRSRIRMSAPGQGWP